MTGLSVRNPHNVPYDGNPEVLCCTERVVLTASPASYGSGMEPRSFRIHVPDVELDELAWRLDHTRWPRSVAASGWGYGLDLHYIHGRSSGA